MVHCCSSLRTALSHLPPLRSFCGARKRDAAKSLPDLLLCFMHCRDARVMWDPQTKRSKGFGFVTFTKLEDAGRAISELNGQLVGSRRLRCDWAQHKLVRVQAYLFAFISVETLMFGTLT